MCVCVCPLTKYINYFTHYLFIQLICIRSSVLADGEESKNHAHAGIQITEKMTGRFPRTWRIRRNWGFSLSRGQRPVDSNALPSLQRREQFYKLFSLRSSLRRTLASNPLPTGLALSCVQPPLLKAFSLQHEQENELQILYPSTSPCSIFLLLMFSSEAKRGRRERNNNDTLKKATKFLLWTFVLS